MKYGVFNTNHLQSDRVQFGKAQKTHHQEKCACKNRKSKPCSSLSSILKGWFIRSRGVVGPEYVGFALNTKGKAAGRSSTTMLRLTSESPCAIFCIKISLSPWPSCVLTRFVTLWLLFVSQTQNAIKRIEIWYDFGDPEGFNRGIENHHKGGVFKSCMIVVKTAFCQKGCISNNYE